MNKILIIDDDRELCALIKRSVQSEHIEADFCNTGKEGLQKLKEQEYQLVVLDVMMPGMDGFETLEEIRKENSLPILMFTSKNDSVSKVRGLRAGADDYLTKPFDMDELIARIVSLIRRYTRFNQQAGTMQKLDFDGLQIDLENRSVTTENGTFELPPKEFELLLYCAKHQGKILTKQQIYTNYIIETKNLTKQYGSQKSVADLNIHVKRGRIYGLLGRNGAGKTTTMKMLLGLTNPTSGEVKIWGKPLQGNEKKLLPRIGSLIESPGFYPNLTGTENLRIFATLRGVPNNHAIKDALDLVGLPYKDKKLFSQYSLGMKQRLAIALAVMHDPELLILDEPINGLDPIGIAEVRSFIRELCDARGKTILISSHILSEISLLADDIGIIDHGALLEEESLAELEQKSSKHIRFTLSDTAQAARILERNFHENHFSIQDAHNLRLHNLDLPVGKIVTAFVENGLEVSEAATSEESLEDYFKRVTGGEGIA